MCSDQTTGVDLSVVIIVENEGEEILGLKTFTEFPD
jgi:hypothetical protein